MNVLTPGFLRELEECIEQLAGDPALRGALFVSAKPSFMAGADIKDMASMFERGITSGEATQFSANLNRIFRRLETCGKPVAAAINGVALGAGFELALACHYRVLADDPKASVGFPEVKIGLLPGAGGTQRLPRLIGVEAALDMIVSGNPINAEKAAKVGLVDRLVEGDVAEGAIAFARELVAAGKGPRPGSATSPRAPTSAP